MHYFMAFDGGGTKLQGILFDEECRLLASARVGGVNSTVHSVQEAEQNIMECVDCLLIQAGERVHAVEWVISSQGGRYLELARRRLPCGDALIGGEGCFGVLTCGADTGLCGLSGTGSDIFYVREGAELDVIGGWGYLLDDDGSGVWIGRQAMRSMMRCFEGVETPSLLHERIREETGITDRETLYKAVYRPEAPAAFLGSFCKMVNEAAGQGDPTAMRILCQAGELLGAEAIAMIKKHRLSQDIPLCVTGSVFRYCGPVRESFAGTVRREYPGMPFLRPRFEPIVGALIFGMLKRGRKLDAALLLELGERYAAFSIPRT